MIVPNDHHRTGSLACDATGCRSGVPSADGRDGATLQDDHRGCVGELEQRTNAGAGINARRHIQLTIERPSDHHRGGIREHLSPALTLAERLRGCQRSRGRQGFASVDHNDIGPPTIGLVGYKAHCLEVGLGWPIIERLQTVRGPIGKGKARATVNGELAVRGTLTFAVDRSS